MRASVAFVALASLVSTSAFAADLPVKAPRLSPVPPVYNWTGFYLGGHVGYFTGVTSNDAGLPNGRGSSWFVGLQGGYRYQFANNVVLGLQVAAPIWGKSQSFNAAPFGGGLNTVKYKGGVVVQGILGYAIDRFLPYATAGIGAAKVEAQEITGAVASAVVTNTHTVYTVGLGVKYAITNNWSVGVGYNHLWTNARSYNCGPAVCGIVGNFKLNGDSVAASIDYKF